MLSVKQLRAVQKIGQRMFSVKVEVEHKQPFAVDDSNPYGDDTVTFDTVKTTVMGWLVPNTNVDFSVGVAFILSEGVFRLRVPVGTDIGPLDRVVIEGLRYAVTDSTIEQTWPEWTTATVRRIQG